MTTADRINCLAARLALLSISDRLEEQRIRAYVLSSNALDPDTSLSHAAAKRILLKKDEE